MLREISSCCGFWSNDCKDSVYRNEDNSSLSTLGFLLASLHKQINLVCKLQSRPKYSHLNGLNVNLYP